jgi:hypothetical protein
MVRVFLSTYKRRGFAAGGVERENNYARFASVSFACVTEGARSEHPAWQTHFDLLGERDNGNIVQKGE